jgi:hypothetical protein
MQDVLLVWVVMALITLWAVYLLDPWTFHQWATQMAVLVR